MRQESSKLHRWGGVSAMTFALAIVVALVMWMVASVWASFDPEVEITLSDDNSGVNADMITQLEVPDGDLQFDGALVTYIPPEWGIGLDEDLPDGTVVGSIDANATLGIGAGQGTCNTDLSPSFTLMDATTQGSAFTDEGDLSGGTWNGFDPTCPGGLDRAVCEYPAFLDTLFPSRPIARYYGHTVVTAGVEAAINLLTFEPGTDLGSGIPDDPDWGYPSVSQLNDLGLDLPPEPGTLVDFCTPLSFESTIFGEVNGAAVRTNPEYGGTYTFRLWARSTRDADGDGYENAIDTCPYDVNMFDPREIDPAGYDLDGIDPACDPAPNDGCYPGAEGIGGDCDADGYHNRGDNCPFIQNGRNYLGDLIGPNNQLDTDNDGIGDECDDNPNTPDGSALERTTELAVEISGPAAPIDETPTPTVVAVDTDGDTVTDDVEELYGSDPEDADSTPEDLAYDAATCSDGVDNDGDGLIDADDSGCAVVEETPTPTPTGEAEYCSPVFPATYNGLVRTDGQPAASGYQVTASIDSVQWGSAIVSGGRYALDIPDSLPTVPPCFEGGTITFALDGMTCTPTADWASGIHTVDLACAPAAPPVTPTPEVTPTPTPPVTPTTLPPSGAGGLPGSSPGLPLWAILVTGWSSLMVLVGVGTLATRIVKR